MKEKIFSLNRALLESPFSITFVCVLEMGQLGREGPGLMSQEPGPHPISGRASSQRLCTHGVRPHKDR